MWTRKWRTKIVKKKKEEEEENKAKKKITKIKKIKITKKFVQLRQKLKKIFVQGQQKSGTSCWRHKKNFLQDEYTQHHLSNGWPVNIFIHSG